MGTTTLALLTMVVLAFFTGMWGGSVTVGKGTTRIDPVHALIVGSAMAFGPHGGALVAVFAGLGRIAAVPGRFKMAAGYIRLAARPTAATVSGFLFHTACNSLGWNATGLATAASASMVAYCAIVLSVEVCISSELSVAETDYSYHEIIVSAILGSIVYAAILHAPFIALFGLVMAAFTAGVSAPSDKSDSIRGFLQISESVDSPEPVDDNTVDDAEDEKAEMLDPLTGAANLRYLMMFLHQEINRSARKQHPLSLLLLDIDNLESINRELGRESGDGMLQKIAFSLKDKLREYDLVARYSGDEFAVVLPETTAETAFDIAERLHKALIKHKAAGSTAVKLSLSIGVASFPEHGSGAEELVSSAHHALNRAKFSGSNRVCSCHKLAKAG